MSIRGTIVGDNEAIRAFAALWGAVVGHRDNLWRTGPELEADQYCDARLVRLNMAREVRYRNHQPFTMDFEVFSHFTTGLVEETDDLNSIGALTFTVEGDLDTHDFTIRVENRASLPIPETMPGFVVSDNEVGEEWSLRLEHVADPIWPPDPPTYTVGGAWVIDVGSRSVTRHRRIGTIESAYHHLTVDQYYRNQWGVLRAGATMTLDFLPSPDDHGDYRASIFYYPRYA